MLSEGLEEHLRVDLHNGFVLMYTTDDGLAHIDVSNPEDLICLYDAELRSQAWSDYWENENLRALQEEFEDDEEDYEDGDDWKKGTGRK